MNAVDGEKVERFGVGPRARRRATRRADELWARDVAARALFKPALGGWIVIIYGPPRTLRDSLARRSHSLRGGPPP